MKPEGPSRCATFEWGRGARDAAVADGAGAQEKQRWPMGKFGRSSELTLRGEQHKYLVSSTVPELKISLDDTSSCTPLSFVTTAPVMTSTTGHRCTSVVCTHMPGMRCCES